MRSFIHSIAHSLDVPPLFSLEIVIHGHLKGMVQTVILYSWEIKEII